MENGEALIMMFYGIVWVMDRLWNFLDLGQVFIPPFSEV